MNDLISTDVDNAVKTLTNGGTILYPTDTIWGIGCDATNARAVEKIYAIKNRIESKSLIVLIDNMEKLTEYLEYVPEIINDLLNVITTPLTVIYPNARNLAKNVIAPDKSIGIRIVRDDFCKSLISKFGKPIVSTSANVSGEPSPMSFRDVSPKIRKQVDYVVKSRQTEIPGYKASKIIKLLDDGTYVIIRE